MHLCKTCIFLEVDRDKECYWCILKDIELTNYSNIEVCNDYISKIVEQSYEKEYTIRNNRPTKNR